MSREIYAECVLGKNIMCLFNLSLPANGLSEMKHDAGFRRKPPVAACRR